MTTDTTSVTFADMGLSPVLLEALTGAGYTTPTPIQAAAVPMALQGRDIIGIAQTGTGKTAAFALPMLEIFLGGKSKLRMPRGLIIAPTRELAAQIADNISLYAGKTGLRWALLVGGESMAEQTKTFSQAVDIVVATPGRLMDMSQRGLFFFTDVRIAVIDEADRMLDMGFIPDIEKIMSLLPKMRQTLMFTATMPPAIKRLTDQFLQFPKEITVSRPASAATTITQHILPCDNRNKERTIISLLKEHADKSTVIFCNRKTDVSKLATALTKSGVKNAMLHGDMLQSKRYEQLEQFKNGSVKVIICSDVAARGLDIDHIGLVINYSLPNHADDYVHRIGRTGRAGKLGVAISLMAPDEDKNLAAIEALMQQKIDVMQTAKNAISENNKDEIKKEPIKKANKLTTDKKPKNNPYPNEKTPAPLSPRPDGSVLIGFGDDIPDFLR
jgi:superfamily II DNA/RNA helicase